MSNDLFILDGKQGRQDLQIFKSSNFQIKWHIGSLANWQFLPFSFNKSN